MLKLPMTASAPQTRSRHSPKALAGRVAGRAAAALLHSPIHRLLSGSVMLLSYPTSGGDSRTIPVMYAQAQDGFVVVAAHPEEKRWWRTMGVPTAVQVRVRGVELDASAVVLSSSDDVRRATTAYVKRFPKSAPGLLDGSAHSAAVVVRVTPTP